ncbi:MAG: DUF1223 domain-containing protein, partial [Dinoroseobacter sp.]|nr:DUF1223 domain-containing protein [Dinoroseobacter sp.]
MRPLIFSLGMLAASALGLSAPAMAEDKLVVVELYTSQGCSSCPPADALLKKISSEYDDVIALALHVDYWDYIGWKDRFALPQYSNRQRQYAREQSLRAVYTPGFVYNGKEWRNWFVSRFLDFPDGDDPGILELDVAGDTATIKFAPTTQHADDLNLNLALLGFELSTQVRAGENQGRRLSHDFVVLGINRAKLKPDNDIYETQLSLPAKKTNAPRYGIVAWVSKDGTQAPIQSVG